MNTLVAALPILVLIWMMVKRSPIASYIALPITALAAALLQLIYFQADLRLLLANSFAGVLSVMTTRLLSALWLHVERLRISSLGARKHIQAFLNLNSL